MTAVTPQGTPDPSSDRPWWPLVVAVGVAGLVLGYLLGVVGRPTGPVAGPDTTTTTAVAVPTTTTAPTTTITVPVDPTLAELVPGFEGTLVVHLGGKLAVWPAHATSPTETSIEPGGTFEYDASGTTAARLVPGAAGNDHVPAVLQVGPARAPGAMLPAGIEVWSFAWHVTEPRRIAWIEGPANDAGSEEPRLLRTGEVTPDGMLLLVFVSGPAPRVPPSADLEAWGSWGFLLRDHETPSEETEILFVEADGSPAWSLVAHQAHVFPSGDVLLVRWVGDRVVLSRTDVTGGEPEGLGFVATGWPIAPDPSGERIAHLYYDGSWPGIVVRGLDGTPAHDIPFTGFRLWDLGWTPDGRFVLAAGETSPFGAGGHVLVALDTEDGNVHQVPFPTWVTDPRVLP